MESSEPTINTHLTDAQNARLLTLADALQCTPERAFEIAVETALAARVRKDAPPVHNVVSFP